MQQLKTISHCIICLLLLIAACTNNKTKKTDNLFIGKWQTADSITLEFGENGKALFGGVEITYTFKHDTLILKKDVNTLSYHFKIENNKLKITGGDLKNPLLFSKVEGGNILSLKEDKMETKPASPDKKETVENADKQTVQSNKKTIYDTWISPQETIELKADGNCMYAGKAYKYTYNGSHIILTTPGGDISIGCILKGDQMTLTTNQGAFVYTRKGTKTTTASTAGKGRELVGKWCYMSNSTNISFNDCFTINANGTYSTNSDNSMSSNSGSVAENSNDYGTWTFDGTTIHVQSRVNGAHSYVIQKTYNKNGDPCIVIGGKTYFSAYRHARW